MTSRTKPPKEFFLETIARVPALAERLRAAKLVSPVTATGNYAYAADRATGPNYLLLGDAFTFIDPMFSTGVYFAMHSAFAGADTVEACLDKPEEAARALKDFEAVMRRGPRMFSWFIYRATSPTLRDLFMKPRIRDLQAGILSVLAGDVFRNTPVGPRLVLFKAIYYLSSAIHFKRSLGAWRQRKRALREALT